MNLFSIAIYATLQEYIRYISHYPHPQTKQSNRSNKPVFGIFHGIHGSPLATNVKEVYGLDITLGTIIELLAPVPLHNSIQNAI